jgi:hypothetical protein
MRLSSRLTAVSLLLFCAAGTLRCSETTKSSETTRGASPGVGGYGAGADEGDRSSTGGAAQPPPETEAEGTYRAPVVTGRYIWTANPDSGQVALIDARDRSVRTVEAGHAPQHLAAVPAADGSVADRAIVLNRKSKDATLLSVGDDGELEEPVFIEDVHEGANALAVSSRGRFVIAWTDATLVEEADPLDGFQEVTVIDLGSKPSKATRLSVGYRPSQLTISQDQKRAFAVTEPGISVIELGDEPYVSRDIEVSDEPLPEGWGRDVSITQDGRYALLRVQDPNAAPERQAQVGIVSMKSGKRVSVQLSGPVTDLDLSEDGSVAVAVVGARYVPRAPEGAAGSAGAGGGAGEGATESTGGTATGGATESTGGTATGGATESTGGTAESGGASDQLPTAGAGGGAGSPGALGGDAGVAGAPDASGGSPPVQYDRLPSEVNLLRIPDIVDHPASFEKVVMGDEMVRSVSLSAHGSHAVLFTTAQGAEDRDHVTIMNLDRESSAYLRFRTEALRSAFVQSVLLAPDDSYAIAVLTPSSASKAQGAFAVIPINEDLAARIEPTRAPPGAVAIGPAPTRMAVVTTASTAKAGDYSYFVRLPDPVVNEVELLSAPLATGIVSTAQVEAAYVAQDYPEGRLTLIEPDPKTQNVIVHDLTGFEQGRLTAVGR